MVAMPVWYDRDGNNGDGGDNINAHEDGDVFFFICTNFKQSTDETLYALLHFTFKILFYKMINLRLIVLQKTCIVFIMRNVRANSMVHVFTITFFSTLIISFVMWLAHQLNRAWWDFNIPSLSLVALVKFIFEIVSRLFIN